MVILLNDKQRELKKQRMDGDTWHLEDTDKLYKGKAMRDFFTLYSTGGFMFSPHECSYPIPEDELREIRKRERKNPSRGILVPFYRYQDFQKVSLLDTRLPTRSASGLDGIYWDEQIANYCDYVLLKFLTYSNGAAKHSLGIDQSVLPRKAYVIATSKKKIDSEEWVKNGNRFGPGIFIPEHPRTRVIFTAHGQVLLKKEVKDGSPIFGEGIEEIRKHPVEGSKHWAKLLEMLPKMQGDLERLLQGEQLA